MILHLNPRDGEDRDLTVLVHRPITPPKPEVEPDERELRSQGVRLAEELIARLPKATLRGLFGALDADWWSREPETKTVAAVTHDGACAGCVSCSPVGVVEELNVETGRWESLPLGIVEPPSVSTKDGESMHAIRAVEDAIDATSESPQALCSYGCCCSVPTSRTTEAILAALREIGWKP